MIKADFINLYLNHINIALVILIIYLTLSYFIFKKQIYSIYDPMLFFLLMSLSAHSVVFFLYYMDKISSYYFYGFLYTQIAFTIGWLLIKRYKRPSSSLLISNRDRVFYLLCIILFVVSQCIVYYAKGIPLFMQFRLELFKGGDGFGVFSRIILVTSICAYVIAIFNLLYLQQSYQRRILDKAVILFFIIVQVLSGSKASVLMAILIASIPLIYSKQFYLPRKSEKKLLKYFFIGIMVSIPLGMITISIQNNLASPGAETSTIDALRTLFLRFVNTGDIFYISWVNNNIDYFHGSTTDGLLAILSDFLRMFRIIPNNELPEHLGLKALWHLTNNDTLDGPNLRHNVFGLFYFGFYGAIVYSFLLGLLVGFIRNKLIKFVPKNMIGLSIFSIFFYIACYIPQDFSSLFMSYFFSSSLLLPFLIFMSTIISTSARKQ